MARVLNQLESIISIINEKSSWISYAAISIMMAFVFSDVILRYFGHPISGSNDIVQALSVVGIAFAIGYTHVKKRHPTISLLVSHLPHNIQTGINITTTLASLALFTLLAWQSAALANHMWGNNEGTMTLGIPLAPLIYGIAFGSALIGLVVMVDLLKLLFVKDIKA